MKTKFNQPNNTRSKNNLIKHHIEPLTQTQKQVFQAFNKNNLILSGSAGTGKTFISTYLALQYIKEHYNFNKIIFIRPLVQTQNIGFLPGDIDEKSLPFIEPYKQIVDNICGKNTYENNPQTFQFLSTSFLRGLTLGNEKDKQAIIIVDEMQNCTFHELDTIITRVGDNSKIIFTGDYYQSDLKSKSDKNGILNFIKIVEHMKHFKHFQFSHNDIVRGSIVKEYIINKEKLNLKY